MAYRVRRRVVDRRLGAAMLSTAAVAAVVAVVVAVLAR
jgi:hypothetical protein